MRVTVRLFARLRELAGTGELTQELAAPATVRAVWTALIAAHPQLEPYAASMSAAVNAEYARMETAVGDGDEVAFLPPVSGGDETSRMGEDGSRGSSRD